MMQAVDVIKRTMEGGDCALNTGCIYKKIPEAQYTYVFCCSVKHYLLNIISSVEVADVVLPFIPQITRMLSEPSCRLIMPIKIDYNYIEVSDGYCSNIENKCFDKNPENLQGSPRAFVRYNCSNTPYPKIFVEGKYFLKEKLHMHYLHASYYIKSFLMS